MPQKKSKKEHDKALLKRIENLIQAFQKHVKDSEGQPHEEQVVYGLRALVSLANMIIQQQDVFGIEPWHIISPDAPLSMPGEMLLRVKDYKGELMPPYPAIMAFYEHGYTAEIDGILFLAALGQFEHSDEKQVSINISARSLRDSDFVKSTLERIESLDLEADEKIIIEIHESTPHLAMSRQVLALYRALDVGFAIDDVGLNMNDVLRLAEFDDLAEYVKIDRHSVLSTEGENSLEKVISFVRTLMPDVVMVAEGVKDAEHAYALKRDYPDIQYAQGLYLPKEREPFRVAFYNVCAEEKTKATERAEKSKAG